MYNEGVFPIYKFLMIDKIVEFCIGINSFIAHHEQDLRFTDLRIDVLVLRII